MPTTLDPPTTARRVLFLEGQILVADDLVAEQSDRLAHRRLHQATAHTPGIARGLGLRVEGESVLIDPGYAVDGYGREVVVPATMAVDISGASTSVDVWLLYDREPGRSPGRWSERAEPLVTPTGLDAKGQPIAIPVPDPTVDLEVSTIYPAPDDPAEEWPVFLGRVVLDKPGVWKPADPPVARPEVRAVGQLVRHPDLDPSRRAEFLVGPETGVDRRRFAVRLSDGDDGWIEPLVIDRRGGIAFDGPLTLGSARFPGASPASVGPSLRLLATNPDPAACPGWDGQAPRPGGRLIFGPIADVPDAARPWQVYAVEPPPPSATPPPGPPVPPIVPSLRFEIEHPGDSGDPSGYRLVIGRPGSMGRGARPAAGPAPPFVPILTVEADGDVTVHGDLYVPEGVAQGPITDNPNDPRFVQGLTQRFVQGLTAGAGAIDSSSLAIDATNATPTAAGPVAINVRINNTSAGPVRSVTAFVTVSPAGGGAALLGEGSAGPFDLGPNAWRDLTIATSAPAPPAVGSLIVGVIASGVNAAGVAVYQSKQTPLPSAPATGTTRAQ